MTDGPIDRDPTRLLHDPGVDESLRQTLRQAASHVPPIDTAAGLARLESSIAGGGAGATGGAGSALSPSILAAGAVAVALLGGGIWYGSQASQETAPVADAPAVAVPVEVPVVEDVVAPAVVEEPVVAVAPEAALAPEAAVAPEAALAPEAAQSEASAGEAAERETAPSRAREPRVEQRAVAEEEPAPVDASALAREMARIAEARRALDADPARALALVDESRREMPRSVLAQERDAIRVLALAGLGRTQEAAPLARRFLDAHPTSPFAERIRRAVALP